jgi:hypothetical protein
VPPEKETLIVQLLLKCGLFLQRTYINFIETRAGQRYQIVKKVGKSIQKKYGMKRNYR